MLTKYTARHSVVRTPQRRTFARRRALHLSNFLGRPPNVVPPRPLRAADLSAAFTASGGTRGGLCAGCKDARYCAAACQRTHWPEHKAACKRASAAAKLAASGDVAGAFAASAAQTAQTAPPAGRPLPRDGSSVTFTGEALGLALMSRFSVRDVEGEVGELRRIRARVPADMLARVEASLRSVPIAEAFRDKSEGGAWHRMQQDLKLWHCARHVFQGVPLPWLTELEAESFMARMGGGYKEERRRGGGGGGDVDGGDDGGGSGGGDSISFGGRIISPPAGSSLRVLRDGDNTVVQAVWPSGRTVVLAAAGPPGPRLDALASGISNAVHISPEEREREEAAAAAAAAARRW